MRWFLARLSWIVPGCALLLPWLTACVSIQPAPVWAGELSATPQAPSPTPFRPLPIGATWLPSTGLLAALDFQAATPSPVPDEFTSPDTPPLHPVMTGEATPASQPAEYFGISFVPSRQRIQLQIFPPDRKVNQGKPITISFYPGDHCKFGDQYACAYAYTAETGVPVIFLTIHSGVGGQAQAFRHALEGTAVNRAAFNLKKILVNLRALQGARVVLSQGESVVEEMTLEVVGRIPPKKLKTYFNSPVVTALQTASTYDAALLPFVQPELPLLVFETCGWKVAGEPGAARSRDTSASVYIGVIRKTP